MEDKHKKITTLFSYLFLFIAVTAVILECLFISSHYFYSHYLKHILVIEIMCPTACIILATPSKPGKQKVIAITLNNSLVFGK